MFKKVKKNKESKIKKEDKTFEKEGVFSKIKKNSKLIKWILIVIISIAIILSILYAIRIYLINKKYAKYEELMNTYGFSLLYNNETPKSSEKVTNLEAVKLVIGSVYNTYDASYVGYQPEGVFEGDEWVKTAVAFGILEKGKINKDNINEYISYWDFIKMFLNARKSKLKIDVSYRTDSKFKNLYSYSDEQRKYVNDLVENELIENSSKKINLEDDVIKGKINEIVVKYVEKYNSILDDGETLVTKKESKPTNFEYYPYITYSIPNEVYEYDQVNQDMPNYISAKDWYKYKKECYKQMENNVNNYYNAILNVDYSKITVENFKESIEDKLLYNYEENVYSDYVNYVKENKIKIQGTAKALLPIVYYDGIDTRVRTKLTFKILNSDTDKNILFGDLKEHPNSSVTYKNKEYTIYIEAPLSPLLNVETYRTEVVSISDLLSTKGGIENSTL